MLSLLFMGSLWLFPILGLLYFLNFCFKKTGRLGSSLLFSIFSFLTYLTHIYPYTLKENNCYFFWKNREGAYCENLKWAVVSQYTSSCFRSEVYLKSLWEDLRKRGFNALIVREVSFIDCFPRKKEESLKIFKDDKTTFESIRIALDRQEVFTYKSLAVPEPIIWLDMKPEETSEASLPICDIISLDKNVGNMRREIVEGEIIRLPFEKNNHWVSLFSHIDMTVVHFNCKENLEEDIHES